MNVLSQSITEWAIVWWQWKQAVLWQGLLAAAILLLAYSWGRRWPARWRHVCFV